MFLSTLEVTCDMEEQLWEGGITGERENKEEEIGAGDIDSYELAME